MVIAHLKIYRRYDDIFRDRHFGGLITLDSSDEPIGIGNASAFWYKPVIQFGFWSSNISYIISLGRCLQHHGGEPERAKGADGMQLFALDCIAYIVDAETI